MANEPERPIEQLLRAAAKKRRAEAGAPLDLHPADRRLLQGEVARQFAKAGAGPRPSLPLLVRMWPRLAWAAAICAVLTVAVALLLPGPGKGERETMLAGNQRMSEARLAREPVPSQAAEPAAVSPQPGDSLERISAGANSPGATPFAAPAAVPPPQVQPQMLGKDSLGMKSLSENAAPAAAPEPTRARKEAQVLAAASAATPAGPSPEAVNGALQPRYAYAAKAVPPAGAPAAPAPAVRDGAVVSTAGIAAADKEANRRLAQPAAPEVVYESLAKAASADRRAPARATTDEVARTYAGAVSAAKLPQLVQRYMQATPGPVTRAATVSKTKPAQPVLASFQVELSGQELKITDGDGSVYSGQVQFAKPTSGLRVAKAKAPAAASAPAAVGGTLEDKAVLGVELDQLAPQNYSFRVAGTNRTLRKKVVFTGNLLAGTTNLVLSRQAGSGVAVGGASAGSSSLTAAPLLNSRITGQAVVGSGKAVQVDALPTTP